MARKQRKSTLWILLALLVVVAGAMILLPSAEEATTEQTQTTQTEAEPKAEPTAEETTIIKAGDTAPDFTVKLYGGGETTLSDLKGKVVLINFWATWCPPCREEFKRVEADLIEKFKGQDFVFLPISRGETEEALTTFREKQGYSFTMGMDEDMSIFKKYATNYIPRNFLVGKDGVVISSTVGYTVEEFDELIHQIEVALK